MYKVVIADDETIIRTSITTLINWEAIGFQVIGDAVNGKGVLAIMDEDDVDVVITDIKMPIMDGIELIERLQLRDNPPIIVVLSAYNDFLLVRNAFKLGAIDYILKADISDKILMECMISLKKKLDHKNHKSTRHHKPMLEMDVSHEEMLRGMALGTTEVQDKYLYHKYYLVCFEIEDFNQQRDLFDKDIRASLIEPMSNFAKQIPRVASRCVFVSISPSRYILCYGCEDEEGLENIKSISQQVMNVWKNYMNIYVSIGISSIGQGEESFFTCLQEAYDCLSMKFIFGKNQICTPLDYKRFDVKQAISKKELYRALANSIKMADNEGIIREQREFFTRIFTITLPQGKKECLNLIYYIAIMFTEGSDSIWNAFNQNTDFYEKVTRLKDIRDIEMWLINFIRWVVDYIENRYDYKVVDTIEQAKCFIADHYSDPAISLGAVAEFVGLSEKYFSTRFSKETGTSFVTYLTKLRVKKAQEMLEKTSMKVYEISEAVGYSSVEHFTRVFKKATGKTPSTYIL